MQVYDISIRFMRRIQVREYEPVEGEVTVKAQIADGEKIEGAIKDAFALASEGVHTALGLEPNTKLATRQRGGHKEAGATTAAAPASKPAAQTPAKPAPQSDIPDDGAPVPQQQTQAPKPAASNSDIPDGPAPGQQTELPAQATSGEQLSAAELSKWIGDMVRLGKVTSQAVMALYPKFGVSRFADLKPDQTASAKVEIEKLIAGTGSL